jgi:PKD repeat protein
LGIRYVGTVNVTVSNPNGTNAGIVPDTVTKIVAGLYVARPPTTSFAGINLATNVSAHPPPNCRLYYSQVTVEPQKSIDYVQRNRNKQVIYRSFVTNIYNNITSGSSFNDLVNSGIVYPTSVLICPFIAATTGANSGFGDFQWKSPFDT